MSKVWFPEMWHNSVALCRKIENLQNLPPSINFQSYGKGFRSQSRMDWPLESMYTYKQTNKQNRSFQIWAL